MRWACIACLLLASLLPVSAEDWTTEDGKTYKNVTVLGQEDDGVRITYDGGVGKIPYYELPVDIQKRFGQDIDSLASKKHAVDKAIEDAVNAAATSQVVPPVETPVVPGTMPGAVPQYVVPNASVPGGTAPGTAATPGTAAIPGTAATPGVAPGAAPGNGNASATSAPGATPNAPNKVGPAAATPGAQPAAHPGVASKPGGGIDLSGVPGLEVPPSQTPHPAGVNAAAGKPLQLAVANYIYNDSLDVCYLDSPSIDIYPGSLANPTASSVQGSSLTLRIVTDGRTPQIPDRFEVTLLCLGGSNTDLGTADTIFNSDTGTITVEDSNRKDSGSLPGGQGMKYASFFLSAAQVHQLASGKPLTLSVGPDVYHIDQRGANTLQDYLTDIDSLQPATSSLVHSFYKMLARIPSFFSIISTICEYLILGSFGLLVAASIAAFILGISRFIKM